MDRKENLDLYFRAALADSHSLHEILDGLVTLRKLLKISQKEIGRRMGVSQSAVSALEAENSNPLVKSIQKYARVLDAKIDFKIDYSRYSTSATVFEAKSQITEFPKSNPVIEYERITA